MGNRGGNSENDERPWPALTIEKRALKDLRMRDDNARSHSLEQIELISDSMDEFGWTRPLLIDEENVVIAGHGCLRAAKLKAWTEGPVVVARGWTEAQKRAYMVMDNRLAERSEWDKPALRSALRSLEAAEFDMELIGFSDEELSKLVIDPAATTPDEKGPTEVVMKVCPACGRMSRKTSDEG